MDARALRRRLRAGAARRPASRGFAIPPLSRRSGRGLAGGEPWFCDYGPEPSRGFRALKVWFTLKEHGTRRLARRSSATAIRRAISPDGSPRSTPEIMAPVALNVVCFRFRAPVPAPGRSTTQRGDRRRSAGVRRRRALHHPPRRAHRDPRRHRQPPHPRPTLSPARRRRRSGARAAAAARSAAADAGRPSRMPRAPSSGSTCCGTSRCRPRSC